MRVVSISHVGSEEDIIEAFVRHNSRFCDEMIILDHGSTDRTVDILRELKAEGFPIHLLRDSTFGHLEIEHVNRLLKLAGNDFGADWVLGLDADEFIGGATDRSFLPPLRDGETTCLKVRLRTYYPTPQDRPGIFNPVERIRHRVESEPEVVKVFVPGWLARHADVEYAGGKHGLLLHGREAPTTENPKVWLNHFSLRTASQYAVKLASRQISKLRYLSSRESEIGFYDRPYRVLREEGFAAFAEQFYDMGIAWHLQPRSRFVTDPMRYLGTTLRYSSTRRNEDYLVHHLLEFAERLARQDARGSEKIDAASEDPDQLTLEVSRPPSERKSVQSFPAQTGWQVLRVPFEGEQAGNEVLFHLNSKPGMVELRQIKLISKDGKGPACQLGPDEIRSRLRVISGGLVVWSHPESVCRLLVSRDVLIFTIAGWDFHEAKAPLELVIDFLFEPRPQLPLVLAPEVLNTLNFERHQLYAERDEARMQLGAVRRENDALRAKLTYELGSVIDFTNKGNAALYLGVGWSRPETWGTWTDGSRATLNLRFPHPPKRALHLQVVAEPLIHPAQPVMRVEVSVNGVRVESWVLTSSGLKKRVIDVPPAALPGETCEIAFDILSPISPAKLGLSDDRRELGLGIARLVVRG